MDIPICPYVGAQRPERQHRPHLEALEHTKTCIITVDLKLILHYFISAFFCSLGPPFPYLELTDPGNDKLVNDLITFLELRMNRKNLLLKDWQQKRE
jgi:hypothetical protein